MPHAIVQTTLTPPSADQLRRAFTVIPWLVDADAGAMAKDTCGILIRDLAAAEAAKLQRALSAAGVETEVVDEDALPPLPRPMKLKRADVADDALILYDALGRPTKVDWPQVRLIATGDVNLRHFKQVRTTRYVHRGTGRGSVPIPVTDVTHREKRRLTSMLELFIGRTPQRYRTTAEEFVYTYLGPRRSRRAEDNFVLLVHDLLARATEASLNRGADAAAADPPGTFAYPARHAFEEEITWLLWRDARSRA